MSKPSTTYYVDNEPQHTNEKELSVATILTNSGNDPATHYMVELKGATQEPLKDPDQMVKIHENQKFAAIYTGPTPVSC